MNPAIEALAERLGLDTPDDTTPEWPRCDDCTLPAVCFGADLVAPATLCGECCPTHRGNDAAVAHATAEGYCT